jgi:hypothetical protein
MSKSKKGICAICGVEGMVTDDHVPPRNIFPKPRPNNVNLITVPTCSKCNGGSSRDDEEFKLYISLKSGMEAPHCRKLHESTRRTIQHNSSLKKRLINGSTKFFLPNPKTGEHEPVVLQKFDPKPILRVSEKIIRGLYFKHFDRPLLENAKCNIWLSDMLNDESRKVVLGLIEDMKISGKIVSIGTNKEFAYLYSGTECEYSTAWLLMFNEQTYIFGLTVKFFNNRIHSIADSARSE